MPTEAEWQELATAARHASANAYCPYSQFPVGAAVRTSDGRVFAGCNVENASSGLTICAERNAIFQAVAAGAPDIAALAVYTPTPACFTPCGACRQVLFEFGASAEVLSACDSDERARFTAASLLPQGFGLPKKPGATG